jgi:hypothetical protein
MGMMRISCHDTCRLHSGVNTRATAWRQRSATMRQSVNNNDNDHSNDSHKHTTKLKAPPAAGAGTLRTEYCLPPAVRDGAVLSALVEVAHWVMVLGDGRQQHYN